MQAFPTDEISVCDSVIYNSSFSSSTKVYIYTIDVKYSKELEQKTKKYPFFPEKTKAETSQFDEWQDGHKKKNCKPIGKLMLELTDEGDYVIDGDMMDWYLANGLKLEDVTNKQKLEYSKSEWLRPYDYDLSLMLRREMKLKLIKINFNDLFFKLMNNLFYGKTNENVYNIQDVKFFLMMWVDILN